MTFYAFLFMFVSMLESDKGLTILFTIIFVLSILARFTIAAAVNKDAKDKHLDSKTMWTILTFIFTFPVAILYAIVTRKADDTKVSIKSRRTLTIITIFIYVAAIVCSGSFLISGQSPDAFDEYTQCVFENEKGEKVLYDKKGTEYTYVDIYSNDLEFQYYDENDLPFTKRLDWGYDEYEAVYPSSKDDDGDDVYEGYSTTDTEIVIDENGCLRHFRIKDMELELTKPMTYKDKEGNVYYDISAVGWNKDGELVFAPIYTDTITAEAENRLPDKQQRLTIEYGVMLILVLLFLIMLSKSVDYDAKSRAIKKSGLYADLAFFGGVIGLIYYLSMRSTAQKLDEDNLTEDERVLKEYERMKQSTKANVSIIIAGVVLIAALVPFVHLCTNSYSLSDFLDAVIKLFKNMNTQ